MDCIHYKTWIGFHSISRMGFTCCPSIDNSEECTEEKKQIKSWNKEKTNNLVRHLNKKNSRKVQNIDEYKDRCHI